MKKLIAVDVDGTLVNSKGEITERTRDALISATKVGHEVMIVSGRATYALRHQAEALAFDKFGGILSSFNGGELFDFKEKRVLASHKMDYNLAKEILEFSKNLDLELMIFDGNKILTDRPDGYYVKRESEIIDMDIKPVKDLRDGLDFAPNKFLFAQDPDKIDKPTQKLMKKFGHVTEQVKSMKFYYEVMPLGLSKGSSIIEACKIFGIDIKDTIVFGDQMNDMSMFEVAGTGVAMANAVDPIKDVADYVTKSNDEDGIAYYLENFILNKEEK